MKVERKKGGGVGLEINTNRRWARSHQQQVNLSKEQESLEEMKAKIHLM